MKNLLFFTPKTGVNWAFTTGVLPQKIGFVRASTGTFINKLGKLETATIQAPRFTHDPVTFEPTGLLCEPQRTNWLKYSWNMEAWTNNSASSVTNNAITSPDGTVDASIIVAGSSYRGRFLVISGLSVNTPYAVSGYVKYSSGTAQNLKVGLESVEGGSANGHIIVNAVTGEILSYGAQTYDRYSVLLPNGWVYYRYRIITGESQTTAVYVAYSWGGDSTFSLWGTQIEKCGATGSATSLIQADGAAATRAADQISFTVPSQVTRLTCVFDDSSTQELTVSAGSYTLSPETLNRFRIKRLYSH